MMNAIVKQHRMTRLTTMWLLIGLVFALFACPFHARAGEYPSEKTFTYHPLSEVGRYAANMYVVCQTDDILRRSMYDYRSQSFAQNGCRPASMYNALSMILGVQTRDDGLTMLHDVMYMLSNGGYKTIGCSVDLLDRLNKTNGVPEWDKLSNCKVLGPLIQAHKGDVLFLNEDLAVEDMLALLQERPHGLVMARLPMADDWTWLPRLTAALEACGLGDARIALMQLSVGVNAKTDPFSLSEEGHYVSFYMQAKELNDDGILYMLDSIVRAVSYDELYSHVARQTYPFVELKYDKYLEIPFNDYYDVRRISSNTLQLALNLSTLSQLQSHTGEEAIALQAGYLSTMELYGRGVVLVQLP